MRETTKLSSWQEKKRKWANKLATAVLAGALLWPMTWHAQEVKVEDVKQNSKELVVNDTIWELKSTTLKFENAKELQDIDSIVDVLMWLEATQQILEIYDENMVRESLKKEVSESIELLRWKYSDEYLNRTLFYVAENTDILRSELDKIITKCVRNKEFQEAYKKWDEKTMLSIIEKIARATWSEEATFCTIILSLTVVPALLLVAYSCLTEKLSKK